MYTIFTKFPFSFLFLTRPVLTNFQQDTVAKDYTYIEQGDVELVPYTAFFPPSNIFFFTGRYSAWPPKRNMNTKLLPNTLSSMVYSLQDKLGQ